MTSPEVAYWIGSLGTLPCIARCAGMGSPCLVGPPSSATSGAPSRPPSDSGHRTSTGPERRNGSAFLQRAEHGDVPEYCSSYSALLANALPHVLRRIHLQHTQSQP